MPTANRAAAEIADLLRAMTGVRTDATTGETWEYPTTPVVERRFKTIAQVNEHPWFCVVIAGYEPMPVEVTVGGRAGFLNAFDLRIVGYVKGDNVITGNEWIDRAIYDVRSTLMANGTLGGDIRAVEIQEIETDEGEFEPIGAFDMRVRVLAGEAMDAA